MRKTIFTACLALLSMFAGCTASEALFNTFGYSGGSSTRAEKEYHYNQQLEASRNHGSWDR